MSTRFKIRAPLASLAVVTIALRRLSLYAALCFALPSLPAIAAVPGSRATEPLVDIHQVDPTIVIDLRYATPRNVLGYPIYPPGARALVRQSVADRLKYAQAYLHARGYGLKIWDAFRPFNAQGALWRYAKSARFVADPENGHALHTWGVAVDATVVDGHGKELAMPSEFDAFTPGASLHYKGDDPTVRADLNLLDHAMGAAGFVGMRSEWWHFVAPDWADFDRVTPEQARDFAGPAPTPAPTPGMLKRIIGLF